MKYTETQSTFHSSTVPPTLPFQWLFSNKPRLERFLSAFSSTCSRKAALG